MNKTLLVLFLTTQNLLSYAQTDTLKLKKFNFHFQQTVITQTKLKFNAPYSGDNSLINKHETASSLTTTLYAGARLWKGAEMYFNPEMSGGAGLSKTLGVAGFPNGETFRVGSAEPAIYIARAYLTHTFGWGSQADTVSDEANQLAGIHSKKYFSITAGKFGLADFFDNNSFSHDPRSQFMNWSLMSNGAWDYPANTRGYVFGFVFELGQPLWTLRLASTMVTNTANGAVWDAKINKAHAFTLEYEKRFIVKGNAGTLRVLAFNNTAKMGSYKAAVATNTVSPDIESTRAYGRNKYGYGVNLEQNINKRLGVFAKASYNDGKTETWAFTEIDHSISFGGVLNGDSWKQKDASLGMAMVFNGISTPHKTYLSQGGYGFLIGDGKLNYGTEFITEIFYKSNIYQKKFWLTPDYQFIVNPAYNRDRGPVHVFSIRAHAEF